jgi:hypothetical protein
MRCRLDKWAKSNRRSFASLRMTDSAGRLVGESMLAKVSWKVKTFCYVGINFGIVFFSVVRFIEGVSPEWSLIIYLAASIWMNLMLWAGFRVRDKGHI